MIYFTSDTHFGHDKDFIYKARGYKSFEEHDRGLIEEWNKLVDENDEVYHLGDLCMGGDVEYGLECIKKLKGKIHLIRGNHDTAIKCDAYKKCDNIVSIHTGSYYLNYRGYTLLLSHYPTLVSNMDDAFTNNKIYSLHGHTHTADMSEFFKYRSINISIDACKNKPILVDDIISFIEEKNAGKKHAFSC